MRDGKREHGSVEEKDAEPRYEISKLSMLAKVDLDETNRLCSGDVDKFYGDGKVIGEDIMENTRSMSQIGGGGLNKQLEGQIKQYKRLRNEREVNLTPLEEGMQQFNSGHLITNAYNSRLLGSAAVGVNDYSTVLSSNSTMV